MFAMFFGAGNVIFPLAIGKAAQGDQTLAIAGLLLTGVLIPFAGVFAIILYEGSYQRFFARLGRWPGFLIALTVISLLGPLGSTPRCIALTYSTLQSSFPHLEAAPFSAFSCLLIFVLAVRKNQLISLIGTFLTPLLLFSLSCIIALGLFYAPAHLSPSGEQSLDLFLMGLQEGYNTMDLLAAFFFSSHIYSLLKEQNPNQSLQRISGLASLIGSILLSIVYIGFSSISSLHSHALVDIHKEALLPSLTLHIAGPFAALLVNSTIALACLTTAIALISAFTTFLQEEVLQGKLAYAPSLALSLLLTFAISTLEFNGISAFLTPVLQVIYPGLIVLTLCNILNRLYHFQPVKIPVYATFLISLLWLNW
ncbi:MAG: braB [Chlamydiales bacterium]|jgi:LIVCS family branched-chain amino acid:cation transporter|nr:braB [Chlamydiales bacterium]